MTTGIFPAVIEPVRAFKARQHDWNPRPALKPDHRETMHAPRRDPERHALDSTCPEYTLLTAPPCSHRCRSRRALAESPPSPLGNARECEGGAKVRGAMSRTSTTAANPAPRQPARKAAGEGVQSARGPGFSLGEWPVDVVRRECSRPAFSGVCVCVAVLHRVARGSMLIWVVSPKFPCSPVVRAQ